MGGHDEYHEKLSELHRLFYTIICNDSSKGQAMYSIDVRIIVVLWRMSILEREWKAQYNTN